MSRILKMWNTENKSKTAAVKKNLVVASMLSNICVGTVLHDVLIDVSWDESTDAVSLPRIPVGRKHRDSYAGSSSPTMLTRTFWVSTQTAKWTNGPAKETCFYLGHTFVSNRPCGLDQGSAVSLEKKKRVKSHGKLFEVSLTPINPPVPPHAPRPTVGQRRNAVQRFCRMSHKWTKDRKITLF